MLFWIFAVLAVLSFVGFFYQAQSREATRMIYSAVVCAAWIALAYYFK